MSSFDSARALLSLRYYPRTNPGNFFCSPLTATAHCPMTSLQFLSHLIEMYGLYGVFVLVMLEGDLTLLLAGVLAHSGFFDDGLLKGYAGGKLDFEPGNRFSYSNTGYILLGGVVEKASGQKFGDFLRERILEPLKLEHSQFGTPHGLPAPRVATTVWRSVRLSLRLPKPTAGSKQRAVCGPRLPTSCAGTWL